MNDISAVVLEINRLHSTAQSCARDAIDYARKAGELLLTVKDQSDHGQFLKWIETNLTVGVRQAQRYMEVARGKTVRLRHLLPKSDMVSHLTSLNSMTAGIFEDDRWIPEDGWMYLIEDGESSYWVMPAENGGIHVSKLYNGTPMSAAGFYWRYTIFAEVGDPEQDADYYIGTRFAPHNRDGINEILLSYGLKHGPHVRIRGLRTSRRFLRPYGEPGSELWYWDAETPADVLYQALTRQGLVNTRGVPVIC